MSFPLVLLYLRQAPRDEWPSPLDVAGLPPAAADYFAGENTLCCDSVFECLHWLDSHPLTGRNLLEILDAARSFGVFTLVAGWLRHHGLSEVFGRDWLFAALATKNPEALRIVLDNEFAGVIDFSRELTYALLVRGGAWARMAPTYSEGMFYPGMDSDTQHEYQKCVLCSGCELTLKRLDNAQLIGPTKGLIAAAVSGGPLSLEYLSQRIRFSAENVLQAMTVYNPRIMQWCADQYLLRIFPAIPSDHNFRAVMDVAVRFPQKAAECIELLRTTNDGDNMFLAAARSGKVRLLRMLDASGVGLPFRPDVVATMLAESACHEPAVTEWMLARFLPLSGPAPPGQNHAVLWAAMAENRPLSALPACAPIFAVQLAVLCRRKNRTLFLQNMAILAIHGVRLRRAKSERRRLPSELWEMVGSYIFNAPDP